MQRISSYRFAPNCSENTTRDNTNLFGEIINLHQMKTSPHFSTTTPCMQTPRLQSLNQLKSPLPSKSARQLWISSLVRCFFTLMILLACLTQTISDYPNAMMRQVDTKLQLIVLCNSALSLPTLQWVSPFGKSNRSSIHSKPTLASQTSAVLTIRGLPTMHTNYAISIYR